jgi:hypothetical protein
LIKGFVMDDERLKNPDGRPDYFDEMLARIRDIRASEKRFYQKVRDLFALSTDYDKTDQTTQQFFATVQNMPLYAVTQKTAAEPITARANSQDPHFGLLNWKGAQVRKQDNLVAKNYLTEDEIDTLNRLVVIFLETAELRTKNRQEIRMAFWQQSVEQILSSNGFTVLTHADKVSHARMEQQIEPMFINFDQRRKAIEARAADEQDAVDLKALENTVKGVKNNESIQATTAGGLVMNDSHHLSHACCGCLIHSTVFSLVYRHHHDDEHIIFHVINQAVALFPKLKFCNASPVRHAAHRLAHVGC